MPERMLQIICYNFFFFFNPHPRICLSIFKWERVREREREIEKCHCERKTSPLHALTGNWTCNLGMCPDQELNLQLWTHGTMLQPNENPGQGQFLLLNHQSTEGQISHFNDLISCNNYWWTLSKNLTWGHPIKYSFIRLGIQISSTL